MDEDKKPLRFTSAWDPVSMLDYNSRVTYKTPNVILDFGKKSTKLYMNPHLENIVKTVKSGFPDPLMGQHSMKDTYSNPSSPSDFIEAGSKMFIAANTAGAAVL